MSTQTGGKPIHKLPTLSTLTGDELIPVDIQDSNGLWANRKITAQDIADLTPSGISSLNALTNTVQTFAKGTTAQSNDWGIVSSGSVHTFHFPNASATNRGLLTTTDWTTFNNKFTLPALTSGSVIFSNGTTLSQDNSKFYYDSVNNRLSLGLISSQATLHIKGVGSTSITTSFFVENSSTNRSLKFTNDGYFRITSSSSGVALIRDQNTYGSPVLILADVTTGFYSPGSYDINVYKNHGGGPVNQILYNYGTGGETETYYQGSTNSIGFLLGARNSTYTNNTNWAGKVTLSSGQPILLDGSYHQIRTSTIMGSATGTPNTSAILELESTAKGFLLPRMTATQGSAITGVNGLVIYVTSTNGTFASVGFWGYEAGAWVKL